MATADFRINADEDERRQLPRMTAAEAAEEARDLAHLLPGGGGPKGTAGARGRHETLGLPMIGPDALLARVDACRDPAVLAHYADATTCRVVRLDGRRGWGLVVRGSRGESFVVAEDPDRWGHRAARWKAQNWADQLARRAGSIAASLTSGAIRRGREAAARSGSKLDALLYA